MYRVQRQHFRVLSNICPHPDIFVHMRVKQPQSEHIQNYINMFYTMFYYKCKNITHNQQSWKLRFITPWSVNFCFFVQLNIINWIGVTSNILTIYQYIKLSTSPCIVFFIALITSKPATKTGFISSYPSRFSHSEDIILSLIIISRL